jgi:hypothetical protein
MVSQHEVQEIIHDLQVKDRMQFTQATLHTSSPSKAPACAGDASSSNDSLPQVIALPALVIVPLHGDIQQLV